MNDCALTLRRLLFALLLAAVPAAAAPMDDNPPTPKDLKGFAETKRWFSEHRKDFAAGQSRMLSRRYDLSNTPAQDVRMFRGKDLQQGVRAKLPAGIAWDELATLTPEEVRGRGVFPEA